MLIDTHAHLTDSKYDKNRDELIRNLINNNVEKVFTVAYNKQSILNVMQLIEKYPNVYGIIGIHPEDWNDFNADTAQLIRKYAKHPKVIAIGEIGLDYHYEGFNKEKQKQVFIEQIKLAHELQLPICIHNRDSIADMLDILKSHKQYLTYGGVMHCYSESVEVYNELKKLGLLIAFGGTLTFKNSVQAPKVCEHADISDILIETDCPYLTPHPYRGEINEPKYTSLVAQKIAEIKKLSYDTVLDITKSNVLKLFKKVNDE